METPKRKRHLFEDDKSTPSPNRARKELRLDSKLDLITDSEKIPKISQKDLSLKYGIGKATVCDILKRKDEYRRQSEENIGSKRIWHVSTGKFSDLNELLFRWFKGAREKNIPLSGPVLQEKALDFAKDLNLDEFKASNGWLESWRFRYGIGFFKVCGESANVNLNIVSEFKSKLPEIVKDFDLKDIFNADETGLFYRTLQDKTLAKRGEECKGGKMSKNRITVMLCYVAVFVEKNLNPLL